MDTFAANESPIYDIFDQNDNFIKQGTSLAALQEGLFTRSVHILIVDADGNILLCQRPLTKQSYPNTFTSSAGGHVEIGESHLDAAHRELQEELGIDLELTDFGRFDVSNEIEHTIHHLFVAFPSKEELDRIRFDETEVATHQYVHVEHIKQQLIDQPAQFAPPFIEAFHLLSTKRQVVFDFDHTIFNWYKFKADLAQALQDKFPFADDVFEKTKEASELKLQGLYNIQAHLEEIAALSGQTIQELESVLTPLIEQGEQYIYPDALKLLKNLKSDPANVLTLLTYGDEKNQLFFVRNTRSNAFFHKIVCVSTKEEKVEWFKRLSHISVMDPYVFNDDPNEASLVIGTLAPHTRHILVERADAKYTAIPRNPEYEVYSDLGKVEFASNLFGKETIPALAAILKKGGVAVIPTDTIYGIVAQALNRTAVEKLYGLKQRTPTKPFIILINDIKTIEDFGIELTSAIKIQVAQHWPGPVSVILECKNSAFEYLHRGTNSLAFRLPDNENLRELIQLSGPLVAPSANTEGHVPAGTIEEAKSYFPDGVDMFLKGPTNQTPSKIISVIGGKTEIIRP